MIYWCFLSIKEWTLFPWISTDENGFEFTWLFIIAGYFSDEQTNG